MKKINLAGCVIINRGKILLLHRRKNDCYELPGGKIDDGEQPEIAAKRELKEELSSDVEVIKKLDEKDFEEDGCVMNYTWFLARIIDGQAPRIGEPEKFDSFEYVPIHNLNKCKLSLNMENLLLELNKGRILLK